MRKKDFGSILSAPLRSSKYPKCIFSMDILTSLSPSSFPGSYPTKPQPQHASPPRLAWRRRGQATAPRNSFSNRPLRRSHRASPSRSIPRQRREQFCQRHRFCRRWRHEQGAFLYCHFLHHPPVFSRAWNTNLKKQKRGILQSLT